MKQNVYQSDIDALPIDLRDKMYSIFNNPLLSIGQMVEFLNKNNMPLTIVKRSPWHGGLWDITASVKDIKTLTIGEMEKAWKHIENKELCDCLWEVVKEVVVNQKSHQSA